MGQCSRPAPCGGFMSTDVTRDFAFGLPKGRAAPAPGRHPRADLKRLARKNGVNIGQSTVEESGRRAGSATSLSGGLLPPAMDVLQRTTSTTWPPLTSSRAQPNVVVARRVLLRPAGPAPRAASLSRRSSTAIAAPSSGPRPVYPPTLSLCFLRYECRVRARDPQAANTHKGHVHRRGPGLRRA